MPVTRHSRWKVKPGHTGPVPLRRWLASDAGQWMEREKRQGIYAVRSRADQLSPAGRQGKPVVKLGKMNGTGRLWEYNAHYGTPEEGDPLGVDIIALMDMGPPHKDAQGHDKQGNTTSANAENIIMHRAKYVSGFPPKYKEWVDQQYDEQHGKIVPGEQRIKKPNEVKGARRGIERFPLTNADVAKIFDDSQWKAEKDYVAGRRSLADPGSGTEPAKETPDRAAKRITRAREIGQVRGIEGDHIGGRTFRERNLRKVT